jgi:hypothetical protein
VSTFLIGPGKQTVQTFELKLKDITEVRMSPRARILKFDYLVRHPLLWVLTDPEDVGRRNRRFRIAKNGDELELGEGEAWHYIGSAWTLTTLSLHCFEILYPVPKNYKGLVYVPPDFPNVPVASWEPQNSPYKTRV